MNREKKTKSKSRIVQRKEQRDRGRVKFFSQCIDILVSEEVIELKIVPGFCNLAETMPAETFVHEFSVAQRTLHASGEYA